MRDRESHSSRPGRGRLRRLIVASLALSAAIGAWPLWAAGPADAEASPTMFASGATRSSTALGWYSSNWAGYVVDRGTYRSVGGQWTVPAVRATIQPTFSALWIGIDGVSSASLIQVGTEQAFYGGRAHYVAWWEILPAPAVPVRTLAVRPGDRISARIVRVRAGEWRITLVDSAGGSFTTTRAYGGPAASAEWIEEAPVVDGQLATLSIHSAAVFDNATANGLDPRLVPSDGGGMIQYGSLVAIPSVPDREGNGFAVSPLGTVPAAPRS